MWIEYILLECGKFYIIELRTKKKTCKHYVAQSDTSRDQGEFHWMDFFEKTETRGDFRRLTSKTCLVDSHEIVAGLSPPVDVLTSSSRAGKLQFNDNS